MIFFSIISRNSKKYVILHLKCSIKMLFNSLQFILFLPIVFTIYWLINRAPLRWQNLFIVVASYVFYGWWNIRFLLLIFFTSICSFGSGLLIQRSSRPKWIMWGNIVLNLFILGVYKYYDFFAQSLSAWLGIQDPILLHWILPVGISFYTFQALSYSIDVYRRQLEPTKDLVAFLAYVSFFPQLVAGPIERATSLLPQFLKPRHFDYALAVDGLRQMLWGFFKKVVVADSCAVYVDLIYANPSNFNGATLLLAAILFTIQIYGDFSGYSDIAIGCSKLFGIKLRSNFILPYFSRDIAEFWRRWHISLSSWFRDYVYIPLGGSRCSKIKVVRNTFVIFILSGFWHGANWTFLAWGFYHALLFIPLIVFGRNRKYLDVVAADSFLPSIREFFQMATTFFLAVIGWILFRSPSIQFAFDYIYQIFANDLISHPTFTSTKNAIVVGLSILILLVVEWHNRRQPHPFASLPRNKVFRWGLYVVILCIILTCAQTSEMPFIYFQF